MTRETVATSFPSCHSVYDLESDHESFDSLMPEEVGSGVNTCSKTSGRKRAFIQHCNEDVYARLGKSRKHGVGTFAIRNFSKGKQLFKTIPGVMETDTVVLTRREIESRILNVEVKRLIYDMFEPMKCRTNSMDDTFSLPAKAFC